MIECPKCKKPNNDTTKFCGYCGAAIKEMVDADLQLLKAELEPKDIQVEKKLGQGGMATVYLAEQVKLDRKIVIKLLSSDLSREDEMRERFLREARTGAKLKHQNIVDIIDVGITEGRPYFIMEFGEKGSLDDLLQKNKSGLPVKDAIVYTAKILRGLGVAHSKQVVHRDIKPENILLRENGEPFIVDFGIAKASSGTVKTQTGLTMGTVNYMSPEQCMGDAGIDGRSDIYSTGIMLYQLLTGELPFAGESPMTIINKHVREKLPSLTTKMATKGATSGKIGNIPIKELEKILQKACEKDKTKRYASAIEMAEALESLVGTGFKPVPVKEKSQREKENEYSEVLRVVYESGAVSETERQTLHSKIIDLGLTLDKAKSLEQKVRKERGIADDGSIKDSGLKPTAKALGVILAILLLAVGGWFGYKALFQKGNIEITTNPKGVQVINAVTSAVEGNTPYYTTKAEPGSYEYKLKLEGYQDEEITIRLRDVNVPEKRDIEMKDLRNVTLDTTPVGATIKITDTTNTSSDPVSDVKTRLIASLQGKTTPARIELKSGKYDVTFQKPGYIEEKLSFTITKDGEKFEKNIKLFTEAEIAKKKEEETKNKEEAKKQTEEKQTKELAEKKQACEKNGSTWNGSSCEKKETVAPTPNEGSGNWSGYQGKMNWDSAKSKCAGIGMRLPTRAQLLGVYNSGVRKEWINDGPDYWSSDESSSGESAYYVSMHFGNVHGTLKDYSHDVRCIR